MSLPVRIEDKNGDIIRALSVKHNISCARITNELLEMLFKDVDVDKIKIQKTGLKITLEKTEPQPIGRGKK